MATWRRDTRLTDGRLAAAALVVEHALTASLPAGAQSTTLVEAARERTRHREIYDGSYRAIGYPMGDVPSDRGVCTDLIVRAYRVLGIDLQVLVHEDMLASFDEYPPLWGLRRPDSNIDHRRVPNLQRFFERAGAGVRVTRSPQDYMAGDLVTWMLPGNLPHIGIVSDQRVPGAGHSKIIHNIGAGPVEDDILFAYPITGHYRFRPAAAPASR